MTLLKLENIRIDGDTQSRDSISEQTVKDYTEHLLEGGEFPDVEVFFDGLDHWLVDGFHRYFAHKRANRDAINVKIHNGTIRDAELYSLGVNDDHGLRRTIADKRKSVNKALNDVEWQEYSDRELAKICKVSPTLVAKMRKVLTSARPTKKKVTKNGKKTTMETKNIGKKKEETSSAKEETTKEKEIEETLEEEYDPKEDEINELSIVNQRLHEENVELKDIKMILDGDQKIIEETIKGLRNELKAKEAELRAVKNSRDQFQNKNAELIKEVEMLRKKNKKLESK
jgi:hypothetical protein